MRTLAAVGLWSIMTACEDTNVSSATDCPGATVESIQLGGPDQHLEKVCTWKERREVITTDQEGKLISHLRFSSGLLDGPQIMFDPYQGVRIESHYRRDIPHGVFREFKNGEQIHECSYVEGLPDGICWSAGRAMDAIEHHVRGRRTGFWAYWFGGEEVKHTRIYGDDILLAFYGQTVPFPPVTIEIDGEVLQRGRCPLTPESPDGCRILFDRYQICELRPDREACRTDARDQYRENAARLRRRREAK